MTITIEWSDVVAAIAVYLAIGCFLYMPLRWLCWRKLNRGWRISYLGYINRDPYRRIIGIIVLWPLAVYNTWQDTR